MISLSLVPRAQALQSLQLHEKRGGAWHVCDITSWAHEKPVLVTRFLTILLDFSCSLNLCAERAECYEASSSRQNFHGSTGDVTHMILRIRLTLLSLMKRLGSLGTRLDMQLHNTM